MSSPPYNSTTSPDDPLYCEGEYAVDWAVDTSGDTTAEFARVTNITHCELESIPDDWVYSYRLTVTTGGWANWCFTDKEPDTYALNSFTENVGTHHVAYNSKDARIVKVWAKVTKARAGIS